jgi:H+-translocating NAD(P) transhydrogenase subunit alpha
MIVGIPIEIALGEQRVALVPELVPTLTKAGLSVLVEPGAGMAAGFLDAVYVEQGAALEPDLFAQADVLLKVQAPGVDEIDRLKEGSTLIGLLRPEANAAAIKSLAARQITAFALERLPRITRAQPMDALSSMSTIAGYKAVLIAANRLPRFFPLLMTAAGTITPARVAVLGVGVAGLQAIATARRLGAVVEAYDIRPAAAEQAASLGAKCMNFGLEAVDAEGHTGYARAQSEEFYSRQRQCLANWLAGMDVVISTAFVPGRPAPVLITEEAVRGMKPGSVIVDLAAEQGGNCDLTRPDEEVNHYDILILGPVNLPSTLPYHASQMYARNVTAFLLHLYRDGQIRIDPSDELIRGPLLTHQGEIVSEKDGTLP